MGRRWSEGRGVSEGGRVLSGVGCVASGWAPSVEGGAVWEAAGVSWCGWWGVVRCDRRIR